MEKIKVDNLSFSYPSSDKLALDSVSLSIPESEFVVLCGKSGCGKSTLLRHLKKSMNPYGNKFGSVCFDGEEIEEMSDKDAASKIGYVQQNPDNQLVTDKVWHELAFGLESLGYSNSVIKRRVAEMASYFGIQTWFRKSVSELSGGQKQLLNLASVMAMQPEVLILDEPASQLDPIAARDFLSTVHRLNRELGVTIVISEHRLEEIFPLADRAIVMDEGRIIANARPSEVAIQLAGNGDDESAHPMYYGMPPVMKLFPKELVRWQDSLPMTLREGRILMEKLFENGTLTLKEAGVQKLAEEKEANSGKPVIKLKNLYFRYAKNADDVLRGLNLEIEEGKLHCLLGGNGSGKSTTLKAICEIIKPQSGKVKIADNCRAAMVPQNPQALFTEISCEEEVLEGLCYQKLEIEEKVQRTEEMLKLMEIEHLRKANPYDLSGGEQQRLALAKVMVSNPNILLLDEPTKGLDPFFKQTLGRILRRLCKENKTIFMVSHDIEFCAEFGDRCSMFFDGEIATSGSAKEFFSGNNFYTTVENKLTRKWCEGIITGEEARTWIRSLL
ncbi:MAG: ABC transporter ATP-binding protein [[Eubacterium] sulci]|jgi:ATPase component of various ABC-type transport systems|nr:ABC transporter ATP-binding protein [[Eubacterium] sulci]